MNEISPLEHLRIERRSYIVGTLAVWAVIVTTVGVLFASMEPQLFSLPRTTNLQETIARMAVLPALTWQQQLSIDGVVLVGAVALFFLNWRFSFLLQRPRGAFLVGRPTAARWIWWAVLSLNSMFYVSLLIPQLVVTGVLARWGKQEIARRGAAAPPPEAQS